MPETALRTPDQSYLRDYSAERAFVERKFEGGADRVEITARTLAMLLNMAYRVGRGTETLKALCALVEQLGVRRVK